MMNNGQQEGHQACKKILLEQLSYLAHPAKPGKLWKN